MTKKKYFFLRNKFTIQMEAPVAVVRSKKVRGEFSLYVKGVVNGMNKSELDKAFKTFGTVINLDVVPTKSCAFVEFGTKEAYQQALMQKNIEIPGLGTVTVEERKQKNRSFYQVDDDAKQLVVPAPSTKTTRKGRDVNRELSLYVRGIVDGMNKTVIDKAFKTFGPVINLDVVPTKSCAFVEFGTKEAYQQALMQKTIEIPGLGTVTVEERKQKENKKNQNRYRYGKSL